MLTMHICTADDNSDPALVVRRVKKLLQDEFGIDHSTIEVEREQCADERPEKC
jgi:Co/Zn/Cd efflux system component